MMRDIITAFIVGSSIPASFIFFIGFHSLQDSINPVNCIDTYLENNDMYYLYTLLAPVYIGVMSAIAVYISNRFNLTTYQAFTIIALISATLVSFLITFCKIYDWTSEEYANQYFMLFFYHAVLYIIIIATIYQYIRTK